MSFVDSIFSATISRGTNILAQYNDNQKSINNINKITYQLLQKLGYSGIKVEKNLTSLLYESTYVFHYIINDGVIYLCVSGQKVQTKIALQFLHRLQRKFLGMNV